MQIYTRTRSGDKDIATEARRSAWKGPDEVRRPTICHFGQDTLTGRRKCNKSAFGNICILEGMKRESLPFGFLYCIQASSAEGRVNIATVRSKV
jgi:hypothetical protein